MKKTTLGKIGVTEEELADFLDNLVDHVSVVDKDFNVLWGNKFARSNFGDSLIGMKCYTAYHGRKEKCPECLVEKTYGDGEIHEHEVMVKPEIGDPIYFNCNSYVLRRNDDGTPEVVVELSKVITDKVKLRKDVDRLFKLTEDREKKMIELKEKIRMLEDQISKEPIATERK